MLGMIEWIVRDGAVFVPVKVVPGASRTRCAGILGGSVKIAVAAPPEKGKANAELIAFIAKAVGVRRGDVSVVEGSTHPRKVVRIANATLQSVRDAFHLDE